jgi:predicted dehydrogenase
MSLPRIAVIGAGSFGRNHLRVVRDSPQATLAAVMDTDPVRAAGAATEFGTAPVADWRELAALADAAIVAAPTTAHAGIACGLLEAGLDVLVEKPIAATLADARRMVATAARHGRILQVGHLERFNPAVIALQKVLTVPLFFEIHRMSLFSPRSLDVDVVLDLMIHDIDLVLALTGTQPEEVRAAGVRILSNKVDIANVRLAFPGGIVANLTASRASTEKVRKLRLFQPHQYISLDYAKQEGVAINVGPEPAAGSAGGEARAIGFAPLAVVKQEPLAAQFEAFLHSCATRQAPAANGQAATDALRVSLDILERIEAHGQVVAQTLAALPG